jgi:hypothetical protein
MLTPADDEAFVAGEPALLLARDERAWRELVNSCGLVGLRRPRLRFVVSSWRRGGHRFDLDNLVDPVLGVVGAPARDRQSVWATVETGPEPGVAISEQTPPAAPTHATAVHLGGPPQRSLRTMERLAELVDHIQLGADEPCGCALTLGTDTRGLVFGFKGPIKPTIDALWPLLGGVAHAPSDHRIQDLRVTTDATSKGISVALWLLDTETCS